MLLQLYIESEEQGVGGGGGGRGGGFCLVTLSFLRDPVHRLSR